MKLEGLVLRCKGDDRCAGFGRFSDFEGWSQNVCGFQNGSVAHHDDSKGDFRVGKLLEELVDLGFLGRF
jgi:hypothetical protein